MTVELLRSFLATLPDDMIVLAPEPFDPEGPEDWEEAHIQIVNGQLLIGTQSFVPVHDKSRVK